MSDESRAASMPSPSIRLAEGRRRDRSRACGLPRRSTRIPRATRRAVDAASAEAAAERGERGRSGRPDERGRARARRRARLAIALARAGAARASDRPGRVGAALAAAPAAADSATRPMPAGLLGCPPRIISINPPPSVEVPRRAAAIDHARRSPSRTRTMTRAATVEEPSPLAPAAEPPPRAQVAALDDDGWASRRRSPDPGTRRSP